MTNENDTPSNNELNDNTSKGLGDTISKIIKNITLGKVKECKPCEERKAKLNKMFPYGKPPTGKSNHSNRRGPMR